MPTSSCIAALWQGGAFTTARRRLVSQQEQVVRTQVEISEIAAPTGDEHARGSWVSQRFRQLGLADVRTDEAGNVIGRRPGMADEPPVAVLAHLDTVFPASTRVSVRREGTRLIGPGIGDNGRGLAAMLALAEVIDGKTLTTRAPVDFVATTGEEGRGDLRGAKHLFGGSHSDALAAIALDGAGDERIVHRALGSRRYRITFTGVGGHSWNSFGVANAVHAAAITAAKLARLALPSEPRAALTVARIGGGLSVNAIPAEAWLEVDTRSTAPVVLDRLESDLRAAVRAAEMEENDRRAHGTAPLVATITSIGDRPSGETSAEHSLVADAVAATRLIGREPELGTASTDANVPIGRGIPAIAIGAGGRGGDAHTLSEWYENTEGALGLVRALGVVVSAAS